MRQAVVGKTAALAVTVAAGTAESAVFVVAFEVLPVVVVALEACIGANVVAAEPVALAEAPMFGSAVAAVHIGIGSSQEVAGAFDRAVAVAFVGLVDAAAAAAADLVVAVALADLVAFVLDSFAAAAVVVAASATPAAAGTVAH